jgi:hypothetical protein
MSRMVRCTCRSHCLTFSPETQSYEGEGELLPKSTAATHRQDDLLSQTVDAITRDVTTPVLNYSPPPESPDHYLSDPSFHDHPTVPPGFHHQSSLDDLYLILEAEATHLCTWAPTNHSLVFASEPTLPYQRPTASEIHPPNRGPYALHPQNPVNTPYLKNESRLCDILVALKRRPGSGVRDRLLIRVYEGLTTMDHHKETEWNRQRAGSVARQHGYSVVDTGVYTLLVA